MALLSSESQIKFDIVFWQTTSKNCTKKRAARVARLFFLIQPIVSVILGADRELLISRNVFPTCSEPLIRLRVQTTGQMMTNETKQTNAAWQRPPTDLFKMIFADPWKTYQKKMETKFAEVGRRKKNASDWFNVKHAFVAYRVELRSSKKGPWPFFSIPCLFLHWYF